MSQSVLFFRGSTVVAINTQSLAQRYFLFFLLFALYIDPKPPEIPRGQIKILQQLGIGEYGQICDGEVQLNVNIKSRTLIKVCGSINCYHCETLYIGLSKRYCTRFSTLQERPRVINVNEYNEILA